MAWKLTQEISSEGYAHDVIIDDPEPAIYISDSEPDPGYQDGPANDWSSSPPQRGTVNVWNPNLYVFSFHTHNVSEIQTKIPRFQTLCTSV